MMKKSNKMLSFLHVQINTRSKSEAKASSNNDERILEKTEMVNFSVSRGTKRAMFSNVVLRPR